MEHQTEARSRWGNTAAWQEHQQKTKAYTKEDFERVQEGLDAIFAEFAACKVTNAPDAPAAQALVGRLKDYICTHFYTCTKEILAGLGEMYASDPRFAANIDKNGEGTAAFVHLAIVNFCRQ